MIKVFQTPQQAYASVIPRLRKPGMVMFIQSTQKHYYWLNFELVEFSSSTGGASKQLIEINNLTIYTITWTSELRTLYGQYPIVQFVNTDTGLYETISIEIQTTGENTTSIIIDFGQEVTGYLIIG